MNQNNMPNVGVTPDVKARMKVFLFYVADIVLVLVWCGVAMIIANLVFPDSRAGINWLFQGINLVFAVWLVITPYHNPGKKNYQLVINELLMGGHYYHSYSYYEFDSLSALLTIGGLKQNAQNKQRRG